MQSLQTPNAGGVIAVFPGTFDPITRGHEDMVRRSARMFAQVVVAVAVGHHKKTLFSLGERMALVREALADCPGVRVASFEGLLRDFMRTQGATVQLRGLRSGTDFDYEFQLAGMNRHLMPEVETVFLTPDPQFQSISSTLVREIATLGGDVQPFVPAPVYAALRDKLKT
ncbi:MAG: pantetheine-phosphate adenylyltransferase [Rhodoferax sp.]